MPHNNFDADPMRKQLVLPGPGATVLASLDYERMAMGFDDFAYLYTLKQAVAAAREQRRSQRAIAAAEAFLRRLEAMIDDDLSGYLDDPSLRWAPERYDTLREEVIDHILQLLPPG
jgi:hypothetical protein